MKSVCRTALSEPTEESVVSQEKLEQDAVAIVATIDTKEAEVSYVADIIRTSGRDVVLVDIGTSSIAAVKSPDPAALLADIGQRAHVSFNQMLEDGRISAIIGIAGGKGSGLYGEVIADLPFGFPKLHVSSARPALLA
jgi:uncharacterized protein (UPF0261 family)